MKRKNIFKVMFMAFFIVITCSACNGTVTRDIRHAGFSVGGEFTCDKFYPKDKNDTSYEKIKYFINSHLINTDGKIYELSLGQVYANKQNCKEADTSITVKAIFDNKIIKGTDNRYYYLMAQNNVAAYSEIPTTDNSYALYDMLLKDDDVVKVVTAESNTGTYYILKTDGNVYSKVINAKNNAGLQLVSTQVVFDKSNYGGSNIIDFNYAGDSLGTFVKTEGSVYRMRITNLDTCSKYADVKCEFAMQEDPIFEKYKDRIITYNGSTLITDYKRMFAVTN